MQTNGESCHHHYLNGLFFLNVTTAELRLWKFCLVFGPGRTQKHGLDRLVSWSALEVGEWVFPCNDVLGDRQQHRRNDIITITLHQRGHNSGQRRGFGIRKKADLCCAGVLHRPSILYTYFNFYSRKSLDDGDLQSICHSAKIKN